MGVLDQIQSNSLTEKLRQQYIKQINPPAGLPLPLPPIVSTGDPSKLRIIAVAGPLWPIDPSDIAFDPHASRDEQQAALDAIQWSDQIDAKHSRQAADDLL